VNWLAPGNAPRTVRDLVIKEAGEPLASPLLLSALDGESARRLEPLYAERGHLVISNASAFRDDPRVPLIIPEVNPEDLALLPDQPWARRGGGIVTNPNCCVAGLALALAPLERRFGIESLLVNTLQALSGAGYPGLSSLDVLGNVLPDIPGEAEKIAVEPCRILGRCFPIAVAVHRVPVLDGHTLTVFARLKGSPGSDEVAAALANWEPAALARNLPSAPVKPLHLHEDLSRPQPRLDAGRAGGMTVSVGPVRLDPVYGHRFTLVVHNTLRGAAGAALLNAELVLQSGLLEAESRTRRSA
jgi:aspartate-semialdehyde dehydrogenase